MGKLLDVDEYERLLENERAVEKGGRAKATITAPGRMAATPGQKITKAAAADLKQQVREEFKKVLQGARDTEQLREFFWVPEPTGGAATASKKVRFISDFEDVFRIPWHENFGVIMPQPCWAPWDMECPHHGKGYRDSVMGIWSVFDYEAQARKLFKAKWSAKSLTAQLMALSEEAGTITDRDVSVVRAGSGKGTTYSLVAGVPSAFKPQGVARYTPDEITAILGSLLKDAGGKSPLAAEE